MKLILMMATLIGLVSCSGDNLEEQITMMEMKKLDTALTKQLGKSKFTKSFVEYISDNTEIKVLSVNKEKTSAEIELSTLKQDVIGGIMTMVMLGGMSKDSTVDDVFNKLTDAQRDSLKAEKKSTKKGTCTLEQKDGSTVVKNCKI